MRLRIGDRLRCSDPKCGLEVLVTETGRAEETDTLLVCSCSGPMKKFYERPTVSKIRLIRSGVAREADGGSRR